MSVTIETFPAVTGGSCDICSRDFEEGDYVAQPNGDEVLCPDCVMDARLLEAA